MEASRSSGTGPRQRAELSAAASVRTGGAEFSASFLALKRAVRRACAAETEWHARVVVGLRAVLEFVADDPAAARALTIQARRGGPAEFDGQDQVVAHFTELLGELAPAERLVAISTDTGIVEAIATIIRGQLLAGTADQLPAALPDLVNLTLLPYTGFTKRVAGPRLAPESSGTSPFR